MSYTIDVPASGSNDQTAFQNAINTLRSNGYGGTIRLEPAEYFVAGLDCTSLSGLRIAAASPNTRISPVLMTTAKPVFDFTGSSNWILEPMEIFASGARPTGIVFPTHAVLSAGLDNQRMQGVRTPGLFTTAALEIRSSSSVRLYDLQLYNDDASAPVLLIGNGLGSNSADVEIYGSEFHCGLTSVPYAIVINQSDGITFRGGISDCSGRSHVFCTGNTHHIEFKRTKFYSELGHPVSTACVECGTGTTDGVSFLLIENPTRTYIPYITYGAGIDSATLRIETP